MFDDCLQFIKFAVTTPEPLFLILQWRHNERDGVSNHQPHVCLLNRLFRRRPKKTSKLCVTALCEGNSPVTGEFPTEKASNAEIFFIWWHHHDIVWLRLGVDKQVHTVQCDVIINPRNNVKQLQNVEQSVIIHSLVSDIRYRWPYWKAYTP